MFAINVKGGTGAGRKRPLLPANTIPWACACGNPEGRSHRLKLNPGYLKRCIDCGEQRDGGR